MTSDNEPQLRAIVGARVSVVKGDEKVSHIAQHKTGVDFADSKRYVIAGTFEDLDISADKYDPWHRPDLGPWLTDERANEWDVIIWSKIDRAFRSTRDCVKFAEWAKEHRKIIHFVDDGLTLDYFHERNASDITGMLAELFLYLGSFFAQLELRRFVGRALDAHRVLRKTNRWPGGQPPYGFQVVPHPSGGKTLAVDPVSSEAVQEAGKMVLAGKSLWEVAFTLTKAGFPTPAQHVYANQGTDSRSKRKVPPTSDWNQSSIGKILRAPATMGLKTVGRSVKERRLARGDDGHPIRYAEPLFSDEAWQQIQQQLDKRKRNKERSHGAAPLLGGLSRDRCFRRC